MSNKCGECEDYYCCKSDSKLRAKYLPKNKKACRDFKPSREYLQAENKKLAQYREYVETRIGESTMPMCYEEWNDAVEELAHDLEEHLKGGQPDCKGMTRPA